MNRGGGHGARGRECGEIWRKVNSTIEFISLLMILAPAGIENNNTSTLAKIMNWSSIKSVIRQKFL